MSEEEKEWEEFQERVKKINKKRDVIGFCTFTKTVGEIKKVKLILKLNKLNSHISREKLT